VPAFSFTIFRIEEVATAPAALIAAWNADVNCAAFPWPVRPGFTE
jgi:hypothetical protein